MEILAQFKNDLRIRRRSPDTIESYPLTVQAFSRFLGGDEERLLRADSDDLTRYLAYLVDKNMNPASIKRYFVILSTFYRYCKFKKMIAENPITSEFKEYYMSDYKGHNAAQRRKCPTIDEAKSLIRGALDPQTRAIMALLLKTGMRRKELLELDLASLDLEHLTIRISPTAKRSNEVVYIDEETVPILKRWLTHRARLNINNCPALFLNRAGNRMNAHQLNTLFADHAKALGLHNPDSSRLEDRLTPHCCRHWFTDTLFKAGMQREFIEELRGDSNTSSIDIYHHINRDELKQSYLDHMPRLT